MSFSPEGVPRTFQPATLLQTQGNAHAHNANGTLERSGRPISLCTPRRDVARHAFPWPVAMHGVHPAVLRSTCTPPWGCSGLDYCRPAVLIRLWSTESVAT
eukprot:1142115-Amphidinium_carterae.2